MRNYLPRTLLLLMLGVAASGCNLFNGFTKDDETGGTPTAPGPAASLQTFAGTWTSSAVTTPSTGCGKVTYTVTPAANNAATVRFEGTCVSSIQATGTGTAKVNGPGLDWSAQGAVTLGGVNCPFSLPAGKVTPDADGTMKITYAGTLCGISVSGIETVKK